MMTDNSFEPNNEMLRELAITSSLARDNDETLEPFINWRHICFLVCAVKSPDTEEYINTQFWQTQIVEPILEGLGYEVVRLDLQDASGAMLTRILAHLRESFLVIVDISYENINVGYELALRHVVGKHCIVMRSRDGQRAGSDIAHHGHIVYDRSFELATNAKDRLKRRVEVLAEDGMDESNPVSEAQIILNSADRSAFVDVHERLDLQAATLARIEALIQAPGPSDFDEPYLRREEMPANVAETTSEIGTNHPESVRPELVPSREPASEGEQQQSAGRIAATERGSDRSPAEQLEDDAREEGVIDRPSGVPKQMSDIPGTIGYHLDPMDAARDYLQTWGAEVSQTVRDQLLGDKDFVMETARSLGSGNLGPVWRISDAINQDAMSPALFPLNAVERLRAQALDPAFEVGDDAVRSLRAVYGTEGLARMAALATPSVVEHAAEALRLNPQLGDNILASEASLRESLLLDPRIAETIAGITRPAWLDDVAAIRPPWKSELPAATNDLVNPLSMSRGRSVGTGHKRRQSSHHSITSDDEPDTGTTPDADERTVDGEAAKPE